MEPTPVNDGSRRERLDAVCVVIPAFNEEQLVGRCIGSVLAAGIPASNIFVVDDRSTDGTAAVVAGFPGVNLLQNPERLGKVKGLQRAIEVGELAGRFQFLALLDADSHVAPDYFDAVLESFERDPGAVLVCGAPRSERYNWLTAFRSLDYAMALFVYRRGQDTMGVITVAPGCASTYRTSILGRLDWDGGTLVEDMDLTIQIHRKGLGRVRFAGRAVAFTQDPRTVRDYLGQITRWYSGTWQVMQLHGLPFGRQRIDLEFAALVGEGLFYSALIVALPIVAWFFPVAAARCLLMDQLVALAGAIACAIHQRRGDVIACFPLFAFVRVLNSIVWLRTFWREVIRRQSLRTWFTVGRYAGDAASKVCPEALSA